MLPVTTTIFEHNEQNKENLDFRRDKPSNEDDDAESDCLIIESDSTTSPSTNSSLSLLLTSLLPKHLSKQTELLLIYGNQTLDVRVLKPVINLDAQQRITISHLNQFYSLPKRYLYLSTPSDFEHVSISPQTRIMYISSSTKKTSLGFICEIPSIKNHFRHLILFDDGSANYTMTNDRIHLCLCQDFQQHSNSIESKIIRENIQELILNKNLKLKQYQIHNYVRVKKFDDNYHNAQVIDIDCSIIKLKFYERQAQTQIWMHQQSLNIEDSILLPIDLASPVIIQNKRKYGQISTVSSSSSPVPSRSLRSGTYHSHQCSSYCVSTFEEDFNPNCILQNPYTLPFSCGWQYLHIDRFTKGRFTKTPFTYRRKTSRSNYLYRSPCGRSFLTLDEIEEYLLKTNSKLTIKYFVEDRSVHLEPSIQYNSEHILDQDITQGKEFVKISVYNENNSNLPEPFIYGTEIRSKLTFRNDSADMTCCSCTDNCRDRLKCACWLKTFEQAKLNDHEQIIHWQRQNYSDKQMISRFGYVHQRLKVPIWSGIYECNSKCLCHTKQCTNRLVQNSLYQQLQLFHTDTKGWALRALHDIPHGSFINVYVGELITQETAMKRDFKYLAKLDHKSHLYTTDKKNCKQILKNDKPQVPVKYCVRLSTDSRTDDDEEEDDDEDDDSCFILDAKYYGSISRFYNHSCKPNVHIQNVFINSHDLRFPVIALFSCRNIRAGEEICWDYNYTVGCMPGIRIDCQCQSSNCRGRLL